MYKIFSRHGRRISHNIFFCERVKEVRKIKVYSNYTATNRFSSTSDIGKTAPLIENCSLPLKVSESGDLTDAAQLVSNAEPTFSSLGLGGWGPVGLVQNCLEYLHIVLDVPWWGTIVIGTIVVRISLFPLVVLSQRNIVNMNNIMPEIQEIQLKMTEARKAGNQLDAARYSQEMMILMMEKGCNPLKNMLPAFAQAPFFISFFMGLRGMANYPVESMTNGGLWWFTDLTVPDQYFLLPVLTSATVWVTLELGVDGASIQSHNAKLMKYMLRAIPVIMIPFTINFPGAILVYWCSNNFISLIQMSLLKIPTVREYLKIPKLIKHSQNVSHVKPLSFMDGAKESWTNMKISKELADRQLIEEIIDSKSTRRPWEKKKSNPVKVSSVHAKSK